MQALIDNGDALSKRRERERRYYYKDHETKKKRSRERSAVFRSRYTNAELRARNPARHLYWGCFARAKKKGLEFFLTQGWIAEQYKNGCAITGIPFADGGTVGNTARSASIDRIDNSRGYTQENCRLVLCAVNVFMGTMTDAGMMVIAAAIVNGDLGRAGA